MTDDRSDAAAHTDAEGNEPEAEGELGVLPAARSGQPGSSHHDLVHDAVTGAVCQICGRHSHPPRLRLTLAKLAAVLPVEMLLHAVVVQRHLSYAATVLTLAITTTALVVWVVEPSTMRLLRTWLQAPGQRTHDRLNASLALWRIRTTVDDVPGALERLTHSLTQLRANILTMHVHAVADGSVDELVVSTPLEVEREDLRRAAQSAGGRDTDVNVTSALALVDQPTRALSLAAVVAADPEELPRAVADLLRAQVVTDRKRLEGTSDATTGPGTSTLKIPSPWSGCLMFDRHEEAFTPAESARAHRLAEIAEANVAQSRRTHG